MPGPYASVVRFYAQLSDFLPAARRGRSFAHGFSGTPSVKDVIESLGVPHTEVDWILVDGRPVGFDHRLADGERLSVYPRFMAIELPTAQRLQPEPLDPPRFVLDTHLGRLAAYLRLLGHDTLYLHAADDAELARVSRDADRTLLTRDRGLLKRNMVVRAYWVRAESPVEQIVEVARRFDLASSAAPFSRCLRCNTPVVRVDKTRVLPRLEPKTRRYFDEFGHCPTCDRVYWHGSHYARMRALVDEILDRTRCERGE